MLGGAARAYPHRPALSGANSGAIFFSPRKKAPKTGVLL
jgi:hypothetical protein